MHLRVVWSISRLRAGHTIRLVTRKPYFPRHTRTMASHIKTIFDAPAPGQRLVDGRADKIYTTIQEGRGYILVPEAVDGRAEEKNAPPNKAGPVQQVFYNPIQQFNRDLTVLAISTYGEEVVEKKKASMKKSRKRIEGKRQRQAERKAAKAVEGLSAEVPGAEGAAAHEGDGSNKRRREEDADDFSNKVARPEVAESPREAQATTGTAADQGNGQTEVGDAIGVNGPVEDPTNNDTIMADAAAPEQPDGDRVNLEGGEDQNGHTNGSVEGEGGQMKDIVPSFTILDALSATGLRALRYAREIPFVTKVTANDLDPSAAESIRRNVRHNKLEHAIEVTEGNAIAHMYTKIAANMALTEKQLGKGKTNKYDVVDLDPYGTAANFFDAAVQAVSDDGGLLCVTCTDAGVWASNGYPEKAFALYGGIPIKGWHCHEAGLRLILNGISTSAARYGLTIEPLLSLSIDFYARVFVKITKSAAAVKFAAGKTMVVYNCDNGCGAWTTQLLLRNKAYPNKKGLGTFYKHQASQGPTADHLCEHCGFKTHLAGPMYAGRLHDPKFIKRILEKLPDLDQTVYGTVPRIKGMLTTALEEHLEERDANSKPKSQEDKYAEIEPYPFFFMSTHLARTVHCATPSEDAFRGALRGLGYRVTRSHCKPGSIKTDAPWDVLWHVMREWIRQKAPVKKESIKPGTAGFRILKMGEQEKQADREENGDDSGEGEKPEDREENGKSSSEGAVVMAKEDENMREVVFDSNLGREKDKEKLVRYQMNPRENWGPMNRARGQ